MWKPIFKFATVLISIVVMIFPLGGAHPKVDPKPNVNSPAVTPSTNEAVFSDNSGPFYFPIIFGGQLAWHCYQDGRKECLNYIFSIKMVSPDEGWAVGADGLIMHYINGSWQQVDSPTGNTLWSLAMISANEGWAMGSGGTVLHYQDGSWQGVNLHLPPDCNLGSVSMTS
ncbi:MAG: hypothetical protein P8Z00_19895, partial [Anaerolineales bacterium]